ncbi:MAG: hypothetical protein J6B04_06635 [Clostridia bacterium]|nr:hypothetical protein [Clostridia bacterium]
MKITFKVDNLKNMNEALTEFIEHLQNLQISEEDIFDSRLVSCELISNVIRHCSDVAVFEGGVSGGFIKISVSGGKVENAQTKPQLPDAFAESGRGLYIIKSLCSGDILTDGDKICVKIKVK